MIIGSSEKVPLEKCPALVLNADFRPLSYYPLSLWCWQDAIKSVFLDKVSIVSNYKRKVRSPSFEMSLPSVIALKSFIKPSEHPNFTRFNVFLRDKFTCQYCGSKRDLTFVSDTARGIILALVVEGIIGETINIGSQRALSIKELAQTIAGIMGKEISINVDSTRFRPHDVDTLICDYNKANKLLGWKPEVSINEGLEHTIKWVKENGITFNKPFKGWTSSYRK